MKKRIIKIILAIIGPLLLVGFATYILRLIETYLNVQNVALLYLIPVVVSTVLWGLTSGILTGFVSFLAFNYFFIKPYNTLLVHQTQDVITLTIFLVVAFLISQLLGQAREAVQLARTKEWEATRMYELISSLAGLTTVEAVIQTLAEELIKIFNFEYVEIEVGTGKGEQLGTCFSPQITRPAEAPRHVILMKTQRSLEGTIKAWFLKDLTSEEEKRLLAAFSDQGALAIERIRLTTGENKLRVLEESDNLKTALLGSVSHELRSPLAAIKASISSLRGGAVDWNLAARSDLLATIDEETDQLNLLVGNLLDMSRIESGELKPHLRWNSTMEIAMGVATKMRNQLKDHFLEFDFPKDLPLIPSDYVMIEQVFTNLISNSVKYAPVKTQILISAMIETDTLKVIVKNHSPAVDDEHLEHIFEKFFRITRADKVIGTGLGLSICKGIIEAHGGKIWAENVTDGFQFVFTLPVKLNGNLPEIPEETANG